MTASIRSLFTETYQYREVLLNIISRDLKLKYKRTYFGYFWSLLNPVLQLAVMGAVFSHIVRLGGMKDYTLFLFSGLLTWMFFQSSLLVASMAYLDNENFIKKIYLPKILFPLSRICLRGFDFLLSFVALIIVGAFMGFPLKATEAMLPAAIVLLFLFTLGVSLVVAVATVFFRDVQYLLTVFLQLLYFATPILYPISTLPEKYHYVIRLNPFYSQVVLFQRLIYDGVMPSGSEWSLAAATALGFLALGVGVLLHYEEDLVFRF